MYFSCHSNMDERSTKELAPFWRELFSLFIVRKNNWLWSGSAKFPAYSVIQKLATIFRAYSGSAHLSQSHNDVSDWLSINWYIFFQLTAHTDELTQLKSANQMIDLLRIVIKVVSATCHYLVIFLRYGCRYLLHKMKVASSDSLTWSKARYRWSDKADRRENRKRWRKFYPFIKDVDRELPVSMKITSLCYHIYQHINCYAESKIIGEQSCSKKSNYWHQLVIFNEHADLNVLDKYRQE